jgi:hypothetical protein
MLLLAFGAWTAGNALYHGLAHSEQGGNTGHEGHVMPAPAAGTGEDAHKGHVMTPGMEMPADPAGHVMEPAADDGTAAEPDASGR